MTSRLPPDPRHVATEALDWPQGSNGSEKKSYPLAAPNVQTVKLANCRAAGADHAASWVNVAVVASRHHHQT